MSKSLTTIAVLTAFFLGCSDQPGFRQLKEPEALERLQDLIGPLDSAAILHKQGLHTQSGSEYWIFTAEKMHPLPTEITREAAVPCPADSVFGFAVSQGVSSSLIEPPEVTSNSGRSSGGSATGSLWQWLSADQSIRVRSVRLKTGYLTIVERLPTK